MNIIFLSYCFVTIVWLGLWYVKYRYWRDQRHLNLSLWVLLGSTGVLAIAWFLNNMWISGIGMLIAVTGVSALFNAVQGKSKQLLRNIPTILVWLVWCTVLSFTLAHIFALWLY